MPEKEHAVAQLKSEVADLQDKIRHLEGRQPSKEKTVVKTLFRWQSFSRPYTKRTAKWFVYTFLLVATIILILLFVHEFFIIAPVLALLFVFYVLTTVPPELIDNAITTQGINTAKDSYIWEEMDDFWFTDKRGFTLLHIDTFMTWPRRILLLTNANDKEKIRELLARYLPYRELPKTSWIDYLADGLSATFHKLAG